MIKATVINSVTKIVVDDIKQVLKKQFSQELLQEYKNEMVAFFISDLKKSLKCISSEINVFAVDNRSELVNVEERPTELILMKKVYKYHLDKMPSPSGIYFLYKNRVLQYIGQSIYVTNRINTHVFSAEKRF